MTFVSMAIGRQACRFGRAPPVVLAAFGGQIWRRKALRGRIRWWCVCAQWSDDCAWRPFGSGAVVVRGGTGSVARATWEAQWPRLLPLPPFGSGGGGWCDGHARRRPVDGGGVASGGGQRGWEAWGLDSSLLPSLPSLPAATAAWQLRSVGRRWWAVEREGQPGRPTGLSRSPSPPSPRGARRLDLVACSDQIWWRHSGATDDRVVCIGGAVDGGPTGETDM
jgi:hypothetical protein